MGASGGAISGFLLAFLSLNVLQEPGSVGFLVGGFALELERREIKAGSQGRFDEAGQLSQVLVRLVVPHGLFLAPLPLLGQLQGTYRTPALRALT